MLEIVQPLLKLFSEKNLENDFSCLVLNYINFIPLLFLSYEVNHKWH